MAIRIEGKVVNLPVGVFVEGVFDALYLTAPREMTSGADYPEELRGSEVRFKQKGSREYTIATIENAFWSNHKAGRRLLIRLQPDEDMDYAE